ncbi:hypothetical protein DMUE_1936 [Dictyocoela muelleri]|nr:hypothetical protein DMUE_1936 [Dictyocoela muelleri]
MGSSGNIPKTFDSFIDKLKRFISGKDLNDLKKLKEETWSEYLIRLRDLNLYDEKNESEVIQKIRRDKSPRIIQCIFYSTDSLSIMIKRVEELEINQHRNDNEVSHLNNKENIGKVFIKKSEDLNLIPSRKINLSREKLCFNCNKPGHIAKYCISNSIGNFLNKKKMVLGLELEPIGLNGYRTKALFDSGSSVNLITNRLLKRIDNAQVMNLEKTMSIQLLNGNCIKSNKIAMLCIKWKEKTLISEYYIIDNGIVDLIIGKKSVYEWHRSENSP